MSWLLYMLSFRQVNHKLHVPEPKVCKSYYRQRFGNPVQRYAGYKDNRRAQLRVVQDDHSVVA
jgi:hypothetical protein